MSGAGASSLVHRAREAWKARLASRSELGEDGFWRYREAIPGQRVQALVTACIFATGLLPLVALPAAALVARLGAGTPGKVAALLLGTAAVIAAWTLLTKVQFRRRRLAFGADRIAVGRPGRETIIRYEDVGFVELSPDRNPWEWRDAATAVVRINREHVLCLDPAHAEQCFKQLLGCCPGAAGVGLDGREFAPRDPVRRLRGKRLLYERRLLASRLALLLGSVVLLMLVWGLARKPQFANVHDLVRALAVIAIAVPVSVGALAWGWRLRRRTQAAPVPPAPTDLIRERVRKRVAEAAAGLCFAGIVGMLLACLFLAWPWINGADDSAAVAPRVEAREGAPLFPPPGDPMWLSSLLAAVVMVYASVEMRRLRRWRLAVTASLVAVFPGVSPLLLLGVPAGIWCLVVLTRSDVRAAFSRVDAAEP